jgi:hypothetical protein
LQFIVWYQSSPGLPALQPLLIRPLCTTTTLAAAAAAAAAAVALTRLLLLLLLQGK